MTNEQTKHYIQSLLRERNGYEQKGLTDRVKAVDEELARVGHKAQAPVKRASTRARKPGGR